MEENMSDVLVDDKNGPSLNRIMTDSRGSSFTTADESRIETILETNGFSSMFDKTPSRQLSIYIYITFI